MYPRFAELLSRSHALVGPMDRDRATGGDRTAGGARRARGRGWPGRSALGRGGGRAGEPAAPLHDLLELWQARDGRVLRLQDYRATGGVRSGVARIAESAYTRLSDGERRVARDLLLRLADIGEGSPERRLVPLSEVERHQRRAARPGRADRRSPADGRGGHGRALARGAAARVASLPRAGSRRIEWCARCTRTFVLPPANGTRAGGIRATFIGVPGSRPRSSFAPSTRPDGPARTRIRRRPASSNRPRGRATAHPEPAPSGAAGGGGGAARAHRGRRCGGGRRSATSLEERPAGRRRGAGRARAAARGRGAGRTKARRGGAAGA